MQLFSSTEIRDLIISVIAITIIFSYQNYQFPSLQSFAEYLVIVIITFGLHELAHKFIARKFGAVASYKMWVQGIFIGVLSMFLPFRFIAPGAVTIYQYKFGKWKKKRFGFGDTREGRLTQDEMGWISMSGPLVNFAIAAIASLLPGGFFRILANLNAFLAFFNMLPMKPLDGSKVFEWRPSVWVFLQVSAIVLLIGINLATGI